MAYPKTSFHFSSSSSIFLLFLFQILLLPSASLSSSSPLILKHRHQSHNSKRNSTKPSPNLQPNQTSTSACNLFSGSWIEDDTYPMYQSSNCPLIDPEFNCQLYGRPDTNYLRYRWKPSTCDLPRFDGLNFLTRMKGKTIMFVGDSLGRNQWESLICMVSAAVPRSATQILKHDPLSAFKFLEYGVTISFYRTPYLVDIDLVQGKRILRLDAIPSNIGNIWKDVDVVSFNSGHWWSHKGELQGWDFMETGGFIYQDMDRLVAFEKGLRAWATWVDANVDTTRTKVFFQGISPIHYNPREWNRSSFSKSKNCYGETEPVSGGVYSGPYPDQMKVLQSVISDLKIVPAYLLDITLLSELRKDGHPSIYSGNLSPDQRANPDRSSDCSHWCLPGPPDTWNQLFYTAMFF